MAKTIKSQILDFVAAKGTATRRDIVKFYVEQIKGRKFDPIKDRNVLTIALGSPYETRGYLRKSSKNERRFLAKKTLNEYYVTADDSTWVVYSNR